MHLHAYKAINKNKYLVHGVELDSDMLIVSLPVFTSMYILSVYMSYTYNTQFLTQSLWPSGYGHLQGSHLLMAPF